MFNRIRKSHYVLEFQIQFCFHYQFYAALLLKEESQ